MPDYQHFLMRHGEGWLLEIVEGTERYFRVCVPMDTTLEDSWNALMRGESFERQDLLAA